MDRQIILNELYKKYIEPTKPERGHYIGVEFEMPIVNLSGEAVDFDIVHALTRKFIDKFGFEVSGIDDDKNVYACTDGKTGDILSYDCSYNNLELSFGKESNLNTIYDRFQKYYTFITNTLNADRHALTGMGVNPHRDVNRNIPIENGRYRMLFHHLHSYTKYKLPMYFHKYPQYGTFSSASQVQLDVEFEKLAQTLNTFSKLEPIKALLFSNSVLLGEDSDFLCCRDMFWENSPHGINPHNVGMYDCEFSGVDDILGYIASTSIYCAERGDKYINFEPVNIVEYFNSKSIAGEYFSHETGKYEQIEFTPEKGDLRFLRTFKFEDLTYRGTIEFRSVCCQPISDCMTTAAFHLGLMNELDKLSEVFDSDTVLYHHGYTASELRHLFVRGIVPECIEQDKLWERAKEVTDIAYNALQKRGMGEERFLAPLYDRISHRTNPAKTMLTLLNGGTPLDEIIWKYGKLA
ncbi:MAG: glutamylcysteine synthetase [Clostridia bacterium]|nr:glutamylcysteine synthetase [Clostridia bacterium]